MAGRQFYAGASHLTPVLGPVCKKLQEAEDFHCSNLNINLADYYDHMQHLISQCWLNGLVKFSLSHMQHYEKLAYLLSYPGRLTLSCITNKQTKPGFIQSHQQKARCSQVVLNAHVQNVCGAFSRATSPLPAKYAGPFSRYCTRHSPDRPSLAWSPTFQLTRNMTRKNL